jgi:hypothetical protein
VEWMRSSVLLGIDRVRTGFGPACILFERSGLRHLLALCRLRAFRGLLGARLLGLALGTRLRDLGARLLVGLGDGLLAVGVGSELNALLLNLRSQLLGLDLRLDLLLLDVGFLLAALGFGSRLGGVAIRVSLGLLDSSFASELLFADSLARHLLGLSSDLAGDAADGALAWCV